MGENDGSKSGDEKGHGDLVDVFERPSAAHSEGQLYAPPRTLPPTSDHRTIEIQTIKVHEDESRRAATQPSLRRVGAAEQAAFEAGRAAAAELEAGQIAAVQSEAAPVAVAAVQGEAAPGADESVAAPSADLGVA